MKIKNIVGIIFGMMLIVGLLSFTSSELSKKNYQKILINEAVLSNNIEATKFLIKQKLNINVKYKYNHTLLHNASLYGDINMVKLLVNSGATLNKNEFGLTAIDSAKDNNHSNVVKLLEARYKNEGK